MHLSGRKARDEAFASQEPEGMVCDQFTGNGHAPCRANLSSEGVDSILPTQRETETSDARRRVGEGA